MLRDSLSVQSSNQTTATRHPGGVHHDTSRSLLCPAVPPLRQAWPLRVARLATLLAIDRLTDRYFRTPGSGTGCRSPPVAPATPRQTPAAGGTGPGWCPGRTCHSGTALGSAWRTTSGGPGSASAPSTWSCHRSTTPGPPADPPGRPGGGGQRAGPGPGGELQPAARPAVGSARCWSGRWAAGSSPGWRTTSFDPWWPRSAGPPHRESSSPSTGGSVWTRCWVWWGARGGLLYSRSLRPDTRPRYSSAPGTFLQAVGTGYQWRKPVWTSEVNMYVLPDQLCVSIE